MIHWLSPADPAQRTGGYLWNARIAAHLGDVRFFLPHDPVPDGPIVADGLAWPLVAHPEVARRTVVVVHSLAVHEGGDDAAERRAWRGVRALVATSAATAREIGDPGVPVHVVIPGTSPAPRARGGDGRTLLTVGTLTRRKGHDRLLHALTGVDRPWRLRCAGAARDPAWAEELRRLAERLGIADRVAWLGDLDDDGVARELDRADLVVQAARYEAFGMAIAEAVARGLPVVTPPAGVAEHLPDGAIEVVDPEDLGPAVARRLEPEARRAQADRAWAAAGALPTWEAQAARLRDAIAGASMGRPS